MKLRDIIEEYISGDWGEEIQSAENPNAIYCVRGADIVPILSTTYENIPKRYVSDRSLNNKVLYVGDIIIEKSGGSPTQSTGRVVYVSEELKAEKPNLLCSNFCVAVRIKHGWDPKFVFYYWQYIYSQGIFFNFEGKTSGLKNLQLDNALASIEIPDIALPEQNRIVECLASFESKIATNREINRNLEAMVGMITDKDLTSKSILKKALSEIATIKAGGDCPKAYSKERFESGMTPIFSNGIVNEGLYGYTSIAEKCVRERSVTVSARGTIGASFIRMESFIPIIRLIAITPNDLGGDVWIHQIIRRMTFEKNGSVQQQLTVPEISKFIIPYPPKDVIKEYEEATSPLVETIDKNKKEIAELQRKRDELLPLLMNGQVSVMPTEVNCDLSRD